MKLKIFLWLFKVWKIKLYQKVYFGNKWWDFEFSSAGSKVTIADN